MIVRLGLGHVKVFEIWEATVYWDAIKNENKQKNTAIILLSI